MSSEIIEDDEIAMQEHIYYEEQLEHNDGSKNMEEIEDIFDEEESEQSEELTDFDDLEMAADGDDLFYKGDSATAARRSVAGTLVELHLPEANAVVDDNFEVNSDELRTGTNTSDSDWEGDDRLRGPYFNETLGHKLDFELVVGMQFSNPKVFRKALLYYAIRKGFDYDFINNRNKRVNAQCRHMECPWRISASWHKYRTGGRVFQIKRLLEHQNCPRELYNKKVTARFLAEYYHEHLKDNPTWTVEAFRRHIRRDLRVNVSYAHCHRAKKFSKEALEGKLGEQYLILRNYCDALKLYNPGTTVHLALDNDRFKRIYICPDACKRGFVLGCRPIISLDACHLKGAYTGQIHSAVGRDGNDNMFPIAYAICEAETKETWVWFIERLLGDIGEGVEHGWTFISDQQKGLGEALKQLMPRSEHRLCVRHLYANFSKQFKGKELKDTMWACARATTHNTHVRGMNHLKELDKKAYLYLEKFDKSVWYKAGFSYFSLCDSLCSNISECFNAFIKDARSEPIITCLETIRCLLMTRFMEKFRGMQQHQGDICPRIWRKLEINKHESMDCEVRTGGSGKFQINSTRWGLYVTDLASRTCECRMWDLTGIPCVHACAAITELGGIHSTYVHQTYSKHVFLRTYQFIIEPISGPVEWPHSSENSILPPFYRKQSGRPKKQRKRQENELKKYGAKSRVGGVIHCGRCGGVGHNKTNCKRDPPDPKRTEAAKKAAERACQYRQQKKQKRAENDKLGITIAEGHCTRVKNAPVQKAKTRRKPKGATQTTMRASHDTNNQTTREWQRPYVNSGNAILYIPPQQQGPVLISSRGRDGAMFTRTQISTQAVVSSIEHLPQPSTYSQPPNMFWNSAS